MNSNIAGQCPLKGHSKNDKWKFCFHRRRETSGQVCDYELVEIVLINVVHYRPTYYRANTL